MTQFDLTRPQFSPIAGLDAGGEFHEPPGWPKAVGIISICLASLGLLCNVCGLVGPAIQKWTINLAPPEKRDEILAQQPPAIFQPGLPDFVLMVLRIGLAFLLLTAGIALVRRRAASKVLHVAYGTIGVLLALIGIGIAAIKLPGQLKYISENPNAPMAMFSSKPVLIGMMVVAAVWFLAYPTFCLIWFGAVKKNADLGANPDPMDKV